MASEAIGIWSPTTVGRSIRAGITMNGVGSCSARLPPVAFSERAPLVLVSRVSDSSGCVGAVKGKPWNVTPSRCVAAAAQGVATARAFDEVRLALFYKAHGLKHGCRVVRTVVESGCVFVVWVGRGVAASLRAAPGLWVVAVVSE